MAFIFVEEKRKVEGSLELDRAKGGLHWTKFSPIYVELRAPGRRLFGVAVVQAQLPTCKMREVQTRR
jgi:hypothetical protein